MRKYADAAAWPAAALFIILELFLASRAQLLFGDFRAFYCAGSTILHGSDPYAGSALYACESAPMPFGLYSAVHGIAVPAPFPGYVIAFFALFAVLPYVAACAAWLATLLATTAASCIALARLFGRGVAAAIAVVVLPLAVVVLPFGELTSIVLCALLWLAVALRARQWTFATVAAAFAMILPHVGIPAILAVFVWERNMRARIAVLAILLAALDVLAGGIHAAIGYVTTILPAHTLSEIGGVTQYGLTWVLHALGTSDAVSVRAGELWYVAMLAAGVILAGALARRNRDVAYFALVPPAFAVFGGSFMHYTEIIVALGAAALLAVRATPRARTLSAYALVLLAMPWLSVFGQPFLVIAFAIVSAAIALLVYDVEGAIALRFSLGTVAVASVILLVANHYGPALAHAPSGSALSPALAQASWSQFVAASRSSAGIVWWLAKAPTWLGLALLAASCYFASRRATQPTEVSTASIG